MECNLLQESPCTTNSLKGEHFSLFTHGGGVIMDEIGLHGASKGGSRNEKKVLATPTEGNSLGLDITDKTDIVSICYSIWFDMILGKSYGTVDDFNNVSEVLAGKKEWGGTTAFHYWSKPALGYYSSSNKEVIRTHMEQLYRAGVDFIIIDLTNNNDDTLQSVGWYSLSITIPMDAICETIMEMRAEGQGTPYVAFWVGGNNPEGRLYQALYERYCVSDRWKDCFVFWNDKPLMLTNVPITENFPCEDLITFRSMNGLGGVDTKAGIWSFLMANNYCVVTNGPDGKPEQIGVAVASQQSYMSNDDARGRQGGLFWYAQWYYAFEVHPKIVTLTWWNEWTAQRLWIESLQQHHFVDAYNQEKSRDIEPMEGGHGDQYYRWLIEYISAYKGGLDCPVLVEPDVEGQVERFLKNVKREARGR